MKEYIKKIKILYSNKKYRALVSLFLYLIGAVIVVSMMQYNYHHKINDYNTDTFIGFDKMTSYAYKYTFNNIEITGIRYQDKERIVYNSDVYYIQNNNLYRVNNEKLNVINDDLVPIKLLELNSTILKSLMEQANKDYSIDNDNITTEEYTLSLTKFLQVYNPLPSTIDNGKNIYLTVTKNKSNIISVLIDLTNYFQEEKTTYKLLIEYSNVNQIDSLTIPYTIEENLETE